MAQALGISYPAGTAGISLPSAEIATGILNRIARTGGWVLRRAGGAITLILTPTAVADGTPFGAITSVLTEDQGRWLRDVLDATGADQMAVGQDLVNNLAVWEHANPGEAPPASLYDDVADRAVAMAAPNSGPTEDNVRITRVLETTLGACAALACPPPVDGYGGGAHGCTRHPTGDGLDSHHMPADSASPLPRDMGPAIRMDPADHRMTSSYGVGATGPAGALAQRGQVLAAFNLDAAEVESRFPGKYTASIAQARAYAECLRAHGMAR